jgi:hypothetical protein
MKKFLLYFLIISLSTFSGCSKDEVAGSDTDTFQIQENQEMSQDLQSEIKEKDALIDRLNNELNETKEQSVIQEIDEQPSGVESTYEGSMYQYDHEQLIESFHNGRYIISLYRQVYKDTILNNIVLPERIKKGDVVAGLTVVDQWSNYHGGEYSILFEGEFTITGTLIYGPMEDAYFIKTNELERVPYVARAGSPSETTFLILDDNGILSYVNDGEIIEATFYNLTLARTYGKPMTDRAILKNYSSRSN